MIRQKRLNRKLRVALDKFRSQELETMIKENYVISVKEWFEKENGRPRTIPLNQIATEILLEKSRIRNLTSDYVFCSTAGKKIDRHNLRRAFNIALKKAEIKDFHFHDLRHTFATRLAQKCVDIYKISKLLGHQDIRMTQRYSHHCPDSLRDGVQILEVDYNLTTVGEKRNVSNT